MSIQKSKEKILALRALIQNPETSEVEKGELQTCLMKAQERLYKLERVVEYNDSGAGEGFSVDIPTESGVPDYIFDNELLGARLKRTLDVLYSEAAFCNERDFEKLYANIYLQFGYEVTSSFADFVYELLIYTGCRDRAESWKMEVESYLMNKKE